MDAETSPPETNPLKDGLLTLNSAGIGRVTRRMVRERAVELAAQDGRTLQETSKSDWDEARRQLTGEPGTDLKDAVLDAMPGTTGWNVVPADTGHQVPAAPGEDEDAEGRSDNERLVNEGMAGAEHDQRRQSVVE